jgi:hypothetical protein
MVIPSFDASPERRRNAPPLHQNPWGGDGKLSPGARQLYCSATITPIATLYKVRTKARPLKDARSMSCSRRIRPASETFVRGARLERRRTAKNVGVVVTGERQG